MLDRRRLRRGCNPSILTRTEIASVRKRHADTKRLEPRFKPSIPKPLRRTNTGGSEDLACIHKGADLDLRDRNGGDVSRKLPVGQEIVAPYGRRSLLSISR